MSLSGLMPPICDDGNLLLDGGYINNLPVDVMRTLGAESIIAIDVAATDDNTPINYGDSLSGWRVLFDRWNYFNRGSAPLSLTEIQYRLAYVSSVRQLEEAKKMDKAYYVKPPVQKYGTLEFNNFDEIFGVGYKCGKELIKDWIQRGVFDKWRELHLLVGTRKRSRRNSV